MAQKCYAAGSDTGLHCAWCITLEIYWNQVELDQAYCEKHEKSCEEMKYYCGDFIGYHPDYTMTDEEEQEIRNKLREQR